MADRRNSATYRAITGGRSPRTETRGWMEGLHFYVNAMGGKAQAARQLDVPRRTLRNWLAGTMPPPERKARITSLVVRAQRRGRLDAKREARLRNAKTIRIEGKDRYNGEDRKVTFQIGESGSTGIAADVMDRLINSYLAGGEALDNPSESSDLFGGGGRGLAAIIADSISDDWYREFFQATDPDWGVDIDKVTIR